ncbi:hypothetical protein AGABI1DRAFT_130028 [Agaricus bisporus var. burnettii JB137-S8]|uniref:RING-type E3 ubiquitin transferase n=1 Tax=Agaricus bisporus var. burnettii (strain JB137-S8 / ATCC MYA-4627 / FGSC 10392) TaxID=597362 RepID=K5XS54_AGABU|nr:uncharacterized protein AGABI1DRAFT_130028 [Agaricus bisporus var. burnettii JB137-S8]EKM77750.1 hypothetical protein AGABI1DRAFT_130028 [Agaricus bisporus var. burnettii JB137-S8]
MVQGTSEKSPQRVCRYYIKGSCRYGNSCWFLHTAPSSCNVGDRVTIDSQSEDRSCSNAMSSSSDNSGSKHLSKVDEPCRRWQAGSCWWGDNCRFRHDAEVEAGRVGETQFADTNEMNVYPATTDDSEGEEHQEAKEMERIERRRKQEEDWAEDATVTIHKMVLDSFVQFEAGLTIQRVICGFEASQILIKNLPLDAQGSEIIAFFTQQGVDSNDLAILRMDTVDDHLQATVLGRAKDVEDVAVGLDGIEFRDRKLEFVVCERNLDGCTTGSSHRNFHFLNISFPKPFLSMIVRYPTLQLYKAEESWRELNGKILNGQRIRAELITDGFDKDSFLPSHAIELSRIPADTTVAEIQTFANTQNVELDRSTTSDEVLNALESHLRSLPESTFQRFTPDNSSRPQFISVKAFFDTWESANSAHNSLSGRFLRPGFPPLRLSLSAPYRFVLTMDENQYNSQKAQWLELCEGKSKEVTILTRTVDRGRRRRVIITLFGRDKQMVGALKVRIKSMAIGQKLDASYWHPIFKDFKYLEFFDDLYRSTGAYVHNDWKHNCLTVSGPADAAEAAKNRIKEEMKRISTEQWTIPLQRQALGFFIREGLAKMKGLLGEENVTLDVKTGNIVLHGADLEEARHHLKQLLTSFSNQNTSSSSNTASEENPCPVCYDNVSEPFEIGCQHVYCSSCLRHYILSTFDNHSFPDSYLARRFEELMEAAFRSYIDKNPETFKYCNTPDCSQEYRATTSPQVLQCPSCFAEKDVGEQERLLRRWATESGVKRCPSCQAWVEKSAGWVFEQNRIYDHMSKEHGGFYNDPEPRVNVGQAVPNDEPDIVDVVGGPAAAAEQMAAFRRIEAGRAYRVQPPANRFWAERPARPPANRMPLAEERVAEHEALRDQPLQAEGEQIWREMRNFVERDQARRREAMEQRREEDRQEALRAQRMQLERDLEQMREREEAMRREVEERRREEDRQEALRAQRIQIDREHEQAREREEAMRREVEERRREEGRQEAIMAQHIQIEREHEQTKEREETTRREVEERRREEDRQEALRAQHLQTEFERELPQNTRTKKEKKGRRAEVRRMRNKGCTIM